MCHRHALDRIYTDAGNNFHHLLHFDVLVQNKDGLGVRRNKLKMHKIQGNKRDYI